MKSPEFFPCWSTVCRSKDAQSYVCLVSEFGDIYMKNELDVKQFIGTWEKTTQQILLRLVGLPSATWVAKAAKSNYQQRRRDSLTGESTKAVNGILRCSSSLCTLIPRNELHISGISEHGRKATNLRTRWKFKAMTQTIQLIFRCFWIAGTRLGSKTNLKDP